MEASQAAAAGQQGDGGAAEAAGPAIDPQMVTDMASRLEAMQGSHEELRQYLQTLPQQLQQQPPAEQPQAEPEIDLSFLDPDHPEFNPAQAADSLRGLIEQTAEQRAQQMMAPLAERLQSIETSTAEERRTREMQNLVDEFPEIRDEKVAQELFSVTRQVAEHAGHPELAGEPWFARMTYMAGRAAQAANEEGEIPPAAHLEGGSGARPGGGQEVDLGDEIVSARRGAGALPFG